MDAVILAGPVGVGGRVGVTVGDGLGVAVGCRVLVAVGCRVLVAVGSAVATTTGVDVSVGTTSVGVDVGAVCAMVLQASYADANNIIATTPVRAD